MPKKTTDITITFKKPEHTLWEAAGCALAEKRATEQQRVHRGIHAGRLGARRDDSFRPLAETGLLERHGDVAARRRLQREIVAFRLGIGRQPNLAPG